jgi:RNA polymerase sigma-70 factor (ECF subfamily)
VDPREAGAAMTFAPPDPESLWRSARAGDPQAFAELTRWLLPWVRHNLYRLRAFRGSVDDLTQEVFVRLIEALPRLADVKCGRAFVLGIATRAIREEGRRRPQDAPAVEPPSRAAGPVDRAAGAETAERLQRALEALPQALREVLVLSVYEGLAPAEIAAVLELSPEAVRHRLFRARALLKPVLGPQAVKEPRP